MSPGPYHFLIGTINAPNGYPRVVPWPNFVKSGFYRTSLFLNLIKGINRKKHGSVRLKRCCTYVFETYEIEETNNPFTLRGCYCAAHELPKVEYSYCEGGDIQACAEDKVTNGWFPLNGVSSHHKSPLGGNTSGAGYQWKVQAFWRWAVE